MKNMTATEVSARVEAYKPIMAARSQRVNLILGKWHMKTLLRVMTNYGPILGFVAGFPIVRRLPR